MQSNPILRNFWLVLALGLLCIPACGPAPEGPGPVASRPAPIINGKDCVAPEQATSVGIILDATMDMFGFKLPLRTVMCTGTLIAPDVVLTAAHCVDPSLLTGGMGTVLTPKYYISFTTDLTALVMDSASVMSGKKADLPADAVEAGSWVPNPGFSASLLSGFKGGLSNLYDVALIFLAKEVKGVQPAVVVTSQEASQLKVGSEVLISGWGQQTAAAQNPFAPAPAGSVGKKICAKTRINELGSHEMQIGSDENSARKCHGDSGGPTYFTVQAASHVKERVVGITSHAYDSSDCKKGGVDTRVDAWLSWIDAEMKKACKDKQRVWCTVEGIVPPSHYDPKPDLGAADSGSVDSGATADGGEIAPAEDSDCQVVRPAAGPISPAWLALVILGALALRRRSRRRAQG